MVWNVRDSGKLERGGESEGVGLILTSRIPVESGHRLRDWDDVPACRRLSISCCTVVFRALRRVPAFLGRWRRRGELQLFATPSTVSGSPDRIRKPEDEACR